MNILSKLPVYAGKWKEVAVESFSQEDITATESAVVVDSQYGKSVCFYLRAGGQTYIPLDTNCPANVGDSIDLTKAKVVTLSRSGDDDIYRVRI